MRAHESITTSVSLLRGVALVSPDGVRVRIFELMVDPAQDSQHVGGLLFRRGNQLHLVHVADVSQPSDGASSLAWNGKSQPTTAAELDQLLLLERDLLDQQIIDIDGHKVVRVNDVKMVWMTAAGGGTALLLDSVEIGFRGATRRLLKGLPWRAVAAISAQVPTRSIPWGLIDLIERDPARRVRLKIGQQRLEHLHPSDIADILEDLAPAERSALFDSLPEETAAETLEEVDPRVQRELLEAMDPDAAADIVEEMDPGAAADALNELSDERSEAILEKMEPEDRQEVTELLDFPERSAAGRMTTYFVGVPASATAADAVQCIREFVERDEGDVDKVAEVVLQDAHGCLHGMVSSARLLLAPPRTALLELTEGHRVSCEMNATEHEVAELFDKYNLLTLPVVDGHGVVQGVVHADQVIASLLES